MTATWFAADVRIDRLVEDEGAYNDLDHALPDITDDQVDLELDWLARDGLDRATRRLVLSFHSYLVRTPTSCILIDTCVGDDKTLEFRPSWHRKTGARWLLALAAAGVRPSDVDTVITTHLHLDHVGWNTTWSGSDWQPTFPRARYLIAREEYQGALARAEDTAGPLAELHATSLRESVDPVVRSGQVDLVASDHIVDDYVRLIPTPGHTAGHVAVAVGLDRDVAVFTGDLLHSPLQAVHPEAAWSGDEQPEIATVSRRAFLERYVDAPTLVCTAHFPAPSVGRLQRWRNGFRLVHVDALETSEAPR
jgi:glyoxylase-like metal-dependent hydrolase (beta-lactamase superfamily II)